MATITFSIVAGALNLTKSFTFPNADATRLADWAKAAYPTRVVDPVTGAVTETVPTNAQAWDRLSKALAQGLLANVLNHERALASKTASDGVIAPAEPT
jgi:hypothetical protein